jgi:hypothetical protein
LVLLKPDPIREPPLGVPVRRIWLLAFAAFFALAASWSLSEPLGAPIDEPSHMLWAAAVSDGQFTPPRQTSAVVWGDPLLIEETDVRVPKEVAALATEINCFDHQDGVPASCYEPLDTSDALVPYVTPMGSYNPLYYLVVGWPVHVLPGLFGLYGMRIISALICAALLACAATTALRVSRIACCGVLVAATPTLLFLAGAVNPNGPEAAGGVLAFAALSALALDPRPELVRSRLAHFALGAGVVTIVRPAGLEWLALLLGIAFVMLGPRRSLALVRTRAGLPSWIGLGVTLLASAAWDLTRGGLNTVPVNYFDGYTVTDSIRDSLLTSGGYIQEMLGLTGWNETPSPFGTLATWLGLLGLLVLGAALFARRHELLVLGVLLLGILLLPVAANASQAYGLVNLWEGRYLLWWSVGLPVYAATLLAVRLDRVPEPVGRRLPPLVFTLFVLGSVGAYWEILRRYGLGLPGPGSKAPEVVLLMHFVWTPPGGWLPGMGLLALGFAVIGLLFYLRRAEGRPPQGAQPGPASDADQPAALGAESTEMATAM